MDSLKQEAERLRLGIRGGWLSVRDAVVWADSRIERATQPLSVLSEVSLAGKQSRENVVALLAAIPGTADATAVMRDCLADLKRRLDTEPGIARDVARWLYHSAAHGDLPASEFGWAPLGLDDSFALADQGIGTRRDAIEQLRGFLSEHAARDA